MRFFIIFFAPLLAVSRANDDLLDELHSRKCSIWDSECLKRQLQRALPYLAAGLPDIGTQRLDPLRIPSLITNHNGVRGDLENIEMGGFANSIIDKVSVDTFSKQYRVRIIIPTFTVNASYIASGFLHTLPFNGEGDMYIRASDLEIDIIFSYDLREDNKGRKFFEFKDYYYSFDTIGGCLVMFENINSEDKKQYADIHSFLEENWKPINAEYGRLYLDRFLDAVFKAVKTTAHVDSIQNYFSEY